MLLAAAATLFGRACRLSPRIAEGQASRARPQLERAPRPVIAYWAEKRTGANWFNEKPTKEWLAAAAAAGIRLVRLAYGKWHGSQRDFLLGDADGYQGLVEKDLALLLRYLDTAASFKIKIVLAPLSLPGARWRQLNDGKQDPRLWTDPSYLRQAARFWKDLAGRLRGHPAIAGYDILNEPHPEIFYGKRSFWSGGFQEWYETVRGGPGDLNRFYRTVVAAIREADPDVPLIVESGLYATPWAFEYLEPLADDKILYSFHMYEPYEYTTRRINRGRFSYPGAVLLTEPGRREFFDSRRLDSFLDPVRAWAAANNVPARRIFVGEFGCDRYAPGAARYLGDLVRIFNREGWHWAFYAFREDTWDSMDYELGAAKPGKLYWDAVASGKIEKEYGRIYPTRSDNKLWRVFKREFSGATDF